MQYLMPVLVVAVSITAIVLTIIIFATKDMEGVVVYGVRAVVSWLLFIVLMLYIYGGSF